MLGTGGAERPFLDRQTDRPMAELGRVRPLGGAVVNVRSGMLPVSFRPAPARRPVLTRWGRPVGNPDYVIWYIV
jgi:hypothetical protein